MFDLAAGTTDRPFRDRRIVPTIVSVITHVALIGAVVSATWYVVTEGLPEVPTMMAFVAEAPPPPPPPPPPAPPAARREPVEAPKPVSSPSPVSERALAAPTVAPTAIGHESGLGFEALEGVPGGVEGGIPGGVPGGVVGGLVTEVQPPPPPAVEEAPVRVGGAVEVPALLRRVEPIYPKPAVAARITGLVILEAKVNEHGEVTDIKVLRSHKLLDQAAIDAVRQWRYEPLLLNGTPRAFVLTVSLSFSLE